MTSVPINWLLNGFHKTLFFLFVNNIFASIISLSKGNKTSKSHSAQQKQPETQLLRSHQFSWRLGCTPRQTWDWAPGQTELVMFWSSCWQWSTVEQIELVQENLKKNMIVFVFLKIILTYITYEMLHPEISQTHPYPHYIDQAHYQSSSGQTESSAPSPAVSRQTFSSLQLYKYKHLKIILIRFNWRPFKDGQQKSKILMMGSLIMTLFNIILKRESFWTGL